MPGRVWAIVAGGGTAGHVLPALAVGHELVRRGVSPESVHFVGARRGPEARLVPAAGFPVTLLPGRGIARSLTLANVGSILGLVVAVARAVLVLARLRPAVVLAVGGYASVPCAVAAALCRVPLVLHEQNAVPGLANRVAGRVARAAAVSFPGTVLPRAVVTGNPVRPEIAAVDRSPSGRARARAELGVPEDRSMLGVFGGSLGARRINATTFALAEAWRDRGDLAIHHVVGGRDWHATADQRPIPPAGGLLYVAVEYEERMPALLAAVDVMLCRAGATTVAELAAAGVPSVLVPLPIAPNDHQAANAKALVDAGAAVMVRDAELTVERAVAELEPLLASPSQCLAMGAAARRQARPDAAVAVADLLEEYARRPH